LFNENNKVKNNLNKLIENSKSLKELSQQLDKESQVQHDSLLFRILLTTIFINTGLVKIKNILIFRKIYLRKHVRQIKAPLALESRENQLECREISSGSSLPRIL